DVRRHQHRQEIRAPLPYLVVDGVADNHWPDDLQTRPAQDEGDAQTEASSMRTQKGDEPTDDARVVSAEELLVLEMIDAHTRTPPLPGSPTPSASCSSSSWRR